MTILSILLIDIIISHKIILILLCVYMDRKSLIRKYYSFYCVLTSRGSPRITHLFFVDINFLFYQHHRQDQIDDGYYWKALSPTLIDKGEGVEKHLRCMDTLF